jgi:hypothetical protein
MTDRFMTNHAEPPTGAGLSIAYLHILPIPPKRRPRQIKRPTDLTGMRFGKLTVKHFAGRNSGGKQIWSCTCDCGRTSIVMRPSLLALRTRSCGCLRGHADRAA